MKVFSKAVCEKIGYYVYILKDPRTSTIFYVGKGTGSRVFQHVEGALVSPLMSDKLNLIREIHNEGFSVEHYILRHGLTQEQSFEIESACIDLLGLDYLTNAVKGHNSWERGLKTVNEINQHYDAKIIEIIEPTIINAPAITCPARPVKIVASFKSLPRVHKKARKNEPL